jgi:hypothetical protein
MSGCGLKIIVYSFCSSHSFLLSIQSDSNYNTALYVTRSFVVHLYHIQVHFLYFVFYIKFPPQRISLNVRRVKVLEIKKSIDPKYGLAFIFQG